MCEWLTFINEIQLPCWVVFNISERMRKVSNAKNREQQIQCIKLLFFFFSFDILQEANTFTRTHLQHVEKKNFFLCIFCFMFFNSTMINHYCWQNDALCIHEKQIHGRQFMNKFVKNTQNFFSKCKIHYTIDSIYSIKCECFIFFFRMQREKKLSVLVCVCVFM